MDIIDVETTNDPTNMALEKVASNCFMHAVRKSSPIKDVTAARAASIGKNQGYCPPASTALMIYVRKGGGWAKKYMDVSAAHSTFNLACQSKE